MQYQKFVNVYHFAPLTEEAPKRKAALEKTTEEQYTGKMKVKLQTRTPLFIPDIREPEREEKHRVYSFFTYDGKTPVIPGSSLRGMLRSVYETLTNSCLSAVDLKEKPVRRTSDAYTPGLLLWNSGKLFLQPACKAIVTGKTREWQKEQARDTMEWGEGQKVWVKTLSGSRPGPKDSRIPTEFVSVISEEAPKTSYGNKEWSEGWYFKGEAGIMKWARGPEKTGYVFLKRGKERLLAQNGETSEQLQELLDVLESYKESSESKTAPKGYRGYQEYRENLKRFLDEHVTGSCFPVHYSEVGEKGTLCYLSPASITKEISYTSVSSILKAQAEHDTCKKIDALCPACRLFGMVGENDPENDSEQDSEQDSEKKPKYLNAYSSRIRVQDALWAESEQTEGTCYEKTVVLQELAGPKKSATEFYLQKPEGENIASWSYDYYTEFGPKERFGKLRLYTPKLSGRKYYWHHRNVKFPPKGAVEKTKRNCTVTPVKSKQEFDFYIYFEQITKQQLDQLIWICNISNLEKKNGKARYGYKLGKGKPLGLGSVELSVEKVEIRRLRKEGRLCYHLASYEKVFGMPYQKIQYDSAGLDKTVKQAFLRLCDFEAVGDYPVCYPAAKGQSVTVADEGFKWFQYNRFKLSGKKKGNKGVTSRAELGFEQHFEKLTEDSPIALRVNALKSGWPDADTYGEEVTATDRIVKRKKGEDK